jgi:ketosteroid isomerase-like protein
MKSTLTLFLSLFSFALLAQNIEQANESYRLFSEAYIKKSADEIFNLYAEDAIVISLYDKDRPTSIRGKEEISSYFTEFFKRFERNNQSLDLAFKVIERREQNGDLLDNGYFHLTVSSGAGEQEHIYGKFSTVLVWVDNQWKFKADASASVN